MAWPALQLKAFWKDDMFDTTLFTRKSSLARGGFAQCGFLAGVKCFAKPKQAKSVMRANALRRIAVSDRKRSHYAI
jgi:hypothetical protein